jgi:hypothetical protein
VKEFLKHIKRNIKEFDISPFNPGKTASLIIIFWGINAVIFLGEVILIETHNDYYGKYTTCTKTKKIKQIFIFAEEFIITKFSTVSFLSIINSLIPENDVVIVSLARGPPSI